MYFLADRSVFAIKLIDWACIEKPPHAIIIDMKGKMFELLLGDNLEGRKEYISDYGHLYLDAADVS